MIRAIAALAAAALLTAAAGPSAASGDPALKAAAEDYVRHPVTRKTIDDMWSVDTMRSFLVPQLKMLGVKLSNDQMETLSGILHEELHRVRPQMEAAMTSAMVRNYTLDEIRALNGFLATELGARAMAKTGAMMQDFNASAGPALRGMLKAVLDRAKAALSK